MTTTVANLKKQLLSLGLETTGNKETLLQRLAQHSTDMRDEPYTDVCLDKEEDDKDDDDNAFGDNKDGRTRSAPTPKGTLMVHHIRCQ